MDLHYVGRRKNSVIESLRNLGGLAVVLLIAGCARVVPYDNVTADRLASLGSEMLALYDTFAQDPMDERRVEMIRAKLRATYDYESSKGERNRDTIRRIEALQLLFERHVVDRKAQQWTKTVAEQYKTQAGELILEVITLEEGKPMSP